MIRISKEDMYHKGDLKIEKIGNYDAREDYATPHKYEGKDVAQLPHSCDEWIIGQKEEIEAMIADLQEALTKL